MVSAQTITSEMFSQKASTSLQTLMCHGLIARLCNCTLSVSGLIKLASTTAAWVVTSGQDQGIAKLVDEALRSTVTREGTGRFGSIGICARSGIHNSDAPISNACRPINSYEVHPSEMQDSPDWLCPKHMHSLCFDETHLDQTKLSIADILKWIENKGRVSLLICHLSDIEDLL